ncbi:SseB family protein [Microbacterium sp. 2FI]|uniref:SseB family protein n=1 Tax=Microbacterium sp. 2FI TaxID=2502193 RepID=UPI0010F8597C|nr:SseB family protein [Microbacterium sp. 2FI]
MAFFSRRKGGADQPDSPEGADAAAEDSGTLDAVEVTDAETEAAASVSISMSSFQGLGGKREAAAAAGITPRPRGPETAPTNVETVPGLRDNVLVRDALAPLSIPPTPADLLNVVRQLLQGHLFLRVKGDARALLAEGKQLPLAVATIGERRFALAYSSGAGLQSSVRADGDRDTSAMAQPALVVIRHVLASGYDGLILDHSSAPARAVLPREVLEKALEKLDESLTVKTLLAGERTPETAAAVVDALARVPLWVAVGRGANGAPGIAEGRTSDGSRYLEVFTHPLEVAVMTRSDQAAPLTAAQLAGALNADAGLSGVMVDPAGPWIRLTREELAPLLG